MGARPRGETALPWTDSFTLADKEPFGDPKQLALEISGVPNSNGDATQLAHVLLDAGPDHLNPGEYYVIAGLITIPLVLFAGAFSVGLPIGLMRRFRSFPPGVATLLAWGGLRGGVSVALALSLPDSEVRDFLVTVTYLVVVFSILVQGLTLAPVIRVKAGQAEKELSRARLPGIRPMAGHSTTPDILGGAIGTVLLRFAGTWTADTGDRQDGTSPRTQLRTASPISSPP